MKSVTLSARQYAMLQAFADNPGHAMKIPEAGSYDQRSFGSMLHPSRRYVVYNAQRGFHLSKEGRAAYHDFLSADIARKVPSEKLTRYFDPSAFGLSVVSRKKPAGKSRPQSKESAA